MRFTPNFQIYRTYMSQVIISANFTDEAFANSFMDSVAQLLQGQFDCDIVRHKDTCAVFCRNSIPATEISIPDVPTLPVDTMEPAPVIAPTAVPDPSPMDLPPEIVPSDEQQLPPEMTVTLDAGCQPEIVNGRPVVIRSLSTAYSVGTTVCTELATSELRVDDVQQSDYFITFKYCELEFRFPREVPGDCAVANNPPQYLHSSIRVVLGFTDTDSISCLLNVKQKNPGETYGVVFGQDLAHIVNTYSHE
jgi:hypothetical protein